MEERGGNAAYFDVPFSLSGGEIAALFPQPPPPAAAPLRRKRGRPRKYGPQNPRVSASLFLSPQGFSSPPSSSTSTSLSLGSKRGRSQEEFLGGLSGQKFTPHFLIVAAGEDVAKKIMSFAQEQNRAVCVISASGTIADVTLRQPASAGGHMTYKGNFEIISLSGSFILSKHASYGRTGALSVCLSEDGFIVGGGLGGPLVAATPVQVVAGSFVVDLSENLGENSKSSISRMFGDMSGESLSMGFDLEDHHLHPSFE